MPSDQNCPHTLVKALAFIARMRGVDITPQRIVRDYVLGNEEPRTDRLLRIADEIGLKTRPVTLTVQRLAKAGKAFPVLLRLRNGNAVVAVDVRAANGCNVFMVRDPLCADDLIIEVDEFRLADAWDGEAIFVKRQFRFDDTEQPFGFSWFLPFIFKQRHIFRDVGLASIVLTLLGMVMPIFFQLIIDRVVVHQSYGTLYVLAVGFLGVILFEVLFSYLRSYLMLLATNRIDAVTNVRAFNKLISLPMHFFEKVPVGVTLKNVSQIDGVRGFLTGQVFFTIIDCISLFVVIPFLFYFHAVLALMVLGVAVAMALLFVVFVPILKRELLKLYEIDARRQSFLVETIQGMRTVKSLALDAIKRHEWDSRVAMAINKRFDVARKILALQMSVMFLQLSIGLVVVGFGAFFVLEGSLTLGSLIAINILTQRVVGPLVQLSQLYQSFQEVSLSVRMLGTIMNHESEGGRSGSGVRAPLRGAVQFTDVRFRYPGASSPAIDRLSFEIQSGTIFGIMGRSGSGKTTITRLLQGLHHAQEGLIRIDGYDLREIDLEHLRSSIGVVLQDSFLFRGTIRENIAAGKSNATLEEVMRAASLAGATEFIEKLPKGFETFIDEGSSNLSGGQRQRLAIARALLPDPPILILDEATSALDAESEAIVQENLFAIANGRTLIIISHRLSSLVPSHAILCMEQGKAVDVGTHAELLARCEVYRNLWQRQTQFIVGAAA